MANYSKIKLWPGVGEKNRTQIFQIKFCSAPKVSWFQEPSRNSMAHPSSKSFGKILSYFLYFTKKNNCIEDSLCTKFSYLWSVLTKFRGKKYDYEKIY